MSGQVENNLSPKARGSKFRHFVFWGAALLTLIGVFLRLYKVSIYPGINGDELVGYVLLRQWWETGVADFISPSGHFPSPFYLALIFPFAFFNAALGLARVPAVLSGVAVLIAHGFWGRKIYPYQVWLSSLVLIACFPIAITMSRVNWEPALTPLMVWFVLYFLQKRNLVFSLLFAVLAVLNQVVAVLLFPSLLIWLLSTKIRVTGKLRIFLPLGILVGVGVLWVALADLAVTYADLLSQAFHRMIDIPGMVISFYKIFQMLAGATCFRGFSIAPGDEVSFVVEHGLPIFALATFLLGFLLAILRKQKEALNHIVFFIFAAIVFCVLAGPEMYLPGFERFPLFLFIPFCLALSFCLDVISKSCRQPLLGAGITGLLALASLSAYGVYYVEPFIEDGGRASQLYDSADQDPKEAALNEVSNTLEKSAAKILVTDCWFSYFTARYYTHGTGIQVLHIPTLEPNRTYQSDTIRNADQFRQILDRGGMAFGLAGGTLNTIFTNAKWPLQSKTFSSKGGAPIVQIWRE